MVLGIPKDYSQTFMQNTGIYDAGNNVVTISDTIDQSQQQNNITNPLTNINNKRKRKRQRINTAMKHQLQQQQSQLTDREIYNTTINDEIFTIDDSSYHSTSCVQIVNDVKGDTLEVKPTDHFRYIFQNINSFRPSTLDKWKS